MTDLEHMTRTAEHTEAAALADLMVSVPPATSAPDGLTGWLESRNVRRHNRWVRLWHPVDTPLQDTPQTDLRVTEIGPADADEFARVVRDAYGFPPEVDEWTASPVGRPGWTHYGAWDGSDLVATGAIFTTGRVAWIAFAATKASHRGRGAQSSLIAERVRRASELGCDWVITETAEELPDRPAPSYRNLRRLGFTDAYRRQNYVADLAGR